MTEVPPDSARTVVDVLCTKDPELALDVRVKELDKVEMVGKLLPFDEIFDPVFMPDIAFAPDV